MKRPLGWIGLIYLSSLAVIFYCYSTVLVIVLSVSAAVFAIAGVIFRLVKRDTKLHRYALVVGLTVLAATLYLFLYQNYIVQPVLSDYSGKEIYVEGYVCDELNISGKHPTCIVQTEKINGEERSVKITLALTNYLDLEQFDRVSCKVKPKASTFPYQFSRGIYLFATETEKSELTVGDEKRVTPYSFAVGLRRAVKKELTIALDNTAASVSKAVLLGDKHALDNDLKDAFTFTGTSYLVVVSGMHLSLVTLLFRRLFRRIGLNEWISLVLLTAIIVLFAAVTGFTPSVMRAGIMLFIILLGNAVLRDPDGVNSLGIAALALALPNPFIVGDVGLLLSFSATFGILLWADRINVFVLKKCRLTDETPPDKSSLWKRIKQLPKKLLRFIVGMTSVSLAATLWVMPVTILFYGTVTPLTVLISLFAYPLVSLILLLSMILAVLYATVILRFITVPIAAVIDFLSWVLSDLILFCAGLPLAQLPAGELYCYIWLAVTALLVIFGYVFRPKKTYIACAVMISSLTLTTGWAITAIAEANRI